MERTNKEDTSTDQRRDTSVPAHGGELPGSHGSISCNRAIDEELESGGASRDLLNPEFRQRMGSTASGRSYAHSDLSHTSGLTEDSTSDRRMFRLEYESLLEKNEEMIQVIERLQAEVEKMADACKKTPNTANSIKNGIKTVTEIASEVRKQAVVVYHGFDTYKCDVEAYHHNHKKREKVRKEKQKAAVAQAAEQTVQEKRSRSPESSPDKREKKRGKKEEKKRVVPTITISDGDRKAVPPKSKRDRILIKVSKDESFASVLKKIKKDFKPELSNATVHGVTSTNKGDVLLKMKGGIDRATLEADLNKVVAGIGEVQKETQRVSTLEIRDLDALVEKGEIEEAIANALGTSSKDRTVELFRPNSRQQVTALVRLNELEALKLEKLIHLRVGFVSCRVRRRIEVTRCFRCLEYGHIATRCRNADRSKLCFKCGSSNHRKKECQESPCCFLCTADQGKQHASGSGACKVFQDALKDAKMKHYRKQ